MPTNLINWFLAASPVISFLIVMIGFKWTGSRAAALSWMVTVLVAWIIFGADFTFFVYTYIKGFLLALDILLIIWTAMLFYVITDQAGTIRFIGDWLAKFSTNRAVQGIFLGWLFPSFLQGMGGFGVPVAVCAPLLVSTGFNPMQSIVMASVGHAWAITFGSMSASFQVLMAASGLPGEQLAPIAAFLLGISVLICGFLVTYIADGLEGVRSTYWFTAILAIIMGAGLFLLSVNGLWIIAVTVPALIALIIGYLFVNNKNKTKMRTIADREPEINLQLALTPYVVLVLATLAVNLIKPINDLLKQKTFTLFFPEIRTIQGFVTPGGSGRIIQLFNHPGLIILASGSIIFLHYLSAGLLKKKDLFLIIRNTAKKSSEASITLFLMVGVANIMSHTHMTSILADGISRFFGANLFPIASPFIGALGAFITGNNSNSNLIFTSLQMKSAELLGLNVPLILAAQTAGASIGSVMAPTKIVLACAALSLARQEGLVISKIIIYGLLIVTLIGILTYSISFFGLFHAG